MEEQEALQPTPSKITKTCSTLLEEIEQEIAKFTDLPLDTPTLDIHAQRIHSKLVFLRNLLNAEIKSKGTKPYDLSEIEQKLTQLGPNFTGESGSGSGSGSDTGSVCESCLNSDRDLLSGAGSDPEVLYEVVARPPEGLYESTMPYSDPEKVEMSGGGRRRWWRTVVVLTTVSAALMVSFSNYLVSNQHEDFLTPT